MFHIYCMIGWIRFLHYENITYGSRPVYPGFHSIFILLLQYRSEYCLYIRIHDVWDKSRFLKIRKSQFSFCWDGFMLNGLGSITWLMFFSYFSVVKSFETFWAFVDILIVFGFIK